MSRAGLVLCVALLGAAACSLDVAGSGVELGRVHPALPDAAMATDGGAASQDAASEPLDAASPARDAAATTPDAGTVKPLCDDDPALVVCYPFDGDALDHGPRENHLDAMNVRYEPGGGVLLRADSRLSCTKNATLAHGQTSILLWLRVDQLPMMGRAGVIDHDGQYGIFLHPGGELRCSMAISAASVASAPAAIQPGAFHHVACIAEASMTRLYVDGVMVASAPGGLTRTPGLSPLNVGENAPDGADQLIGAIDDVRILEAEWTAAQVAEAAEARSPAE